ncbi:hypothetical protein AAFF_G00413600 [Aldrovandia affinis]|uniref:Uncharacterized protein n=1 Tax=Aldrovandia affinis TaxID=143900 RepID=A0AAD7SBL8_9TELE|nr:hypothetical protein AAFF_G00413600 [Aldrovandia affinis]
MKGGVTEDFKRAATPFELSQTACCKTAASLRLCQGNRETVRKQTPRQKLLQSPASTSRPSVNREKRDRCSDNTTDAIVDRSWTPRFDSVPWT